MADNKNQHFVPKVHFKPFTIKGEGRAIHIFNIDRMKPVFNAPVKNQCSADYFYGRDSLLEEAIQFLEGNYGDSVRALEATNSKITAREQVILRRFMYLQHLRTEAAAKAGADLTAALFSVEGSDLELPSRGDAIKASAITAMRHFSDTMNVVDDLKLRIVRNFTSSPFITSDDPVIMANRWHQGNAMCRSFSFAMSSAGIIVLMPLTPKILALLFDGDIYSVEHSFGFVDVKLDDDVNACNQLQALSCSANLYFDKPDFEGLLRATVAAVIERRLSSKFQVTHAVAEQTVGTHKRYRVMEAPDVREHGRVLVHAKSIRPEPVVWPSFLKYRRSAIAFTNGTRAGFRRRATTYFYPDSPPWRKLRL